MRTLNSPAKTCLRSTLNREIEQEEEREQLREDNAKLRELLVGLYSESYIESVLASDENKYMR